MPGTRWRSTTAAASGRRACQMPAGSTKTAATLPSSHPSTFSAETSWRCALAGGTRPPKPPTARFSPGALGGTVRPGTATPMMLRCHARSIFWKTLRLKSWNLLSAGVFVSSPRMPACLPGAITALDSLGSATWSREHGPTACCTGTRVDELLRLFAAHLGHALKF